MEAVVSFLRVILGVLSGLSLARIVLYLYSKLTNEEDKREVFWVSIAIVVFLLSTMMLNLKD